jgi:hypothetical protein
MYRRKYGRSNRVADGTYSEKLTYNVELKVTSTDGINGNA